MYFLLVMMQRSKVNVWSIKKGLDSFLMIQLIRMPFLFKVINPPSATLRTEPSKFKYDNTEQESLQVINYQ